MSPLSIRSVESIPNLLPMEGGDLPRIEVTWMEGSPYTENVLITSDLHKDLVPVLDHLDTILRPEEWVFISAGDMAGTTRFGVDGNPTEGYRRILKEFKVFYFIAGNHDILDEECQTWTNKDGSPCDLAVGGVREIAGQKFLGQHGIISTKQKPNRFSLEEYQKPFKAGTKVHTVVTHQPVQIDGFAPEIRPCGLEPVVIELKPSLYVFGHHHVEPALLTAGEITYLSCDSRVFLFEKN